MKKQTAVEWFNQQLVDRQNGNGDSRSRDEIYNQAKEMEKEQIINAVYYNCSAMSFSDLPCGEEYYQKTFKSE